MPKALLQCFLVMLIGMTLASTSSAASVPAPACGDCCAYSAAQGACASVCVPDVPTAQAVEQSGAKPLALGDGGARGPFVVSVRTEPLRPSAVNGSHGPPAYLRFGRLLL